MKIINGEQAARDIRLALQNEILEKDLTPNLAIILVGKDEASQKYVSLKKKASEELRIQFHLYAFDETATQHQIEEAIDFLNADTDIDGILIQLPLPKHLDTDALVNRIQPEKDADGFGKKNLKKYLKKQPDAWTPGLVESINTLIQKTGTPIKGKHAVILANSSIFSLAMTEMLESQDVHVTTLLQPSQKDFLQLHNADIIIIILGRKLILEAGQTKNNAIIIDAGYNRENGSPCGDVNIETFRDTDVWVTPVPGGVGPMTVAMLLKRVVAFYKKNHA